MHGTVSTNRQHKVCRLLGKHNIRKIQDGVESKFVGHILDTVLVSQITSYIGHCVRNI